MNAQTPILDQLVLDGRMAADWPPSLRAVDPAIDVKVERCLSKVRQFRPYVPKSTLVWRVFEMPPKQVRVVIVGQDPYPNPALATGLAFSTGPRGPISESLEYIFDELKNTGVQLPAHGDLSRWIDQGVFLLNRALTLPQTSSTGPRVHFGLWAAVLRATLRAIAVEGSSRPIAALLWGAKARQLRQFLEPDVQVFESSHPSPKSATYEDGVVDPFVGSRPFTKVNSWLAAQDPPAPPVNWDLVP
jgi:uracil-DNA glycosylase